MIQCPHCKTQSSRVVDKRNKPDGRVRRRRRCDECGLRYSTVEVVIFEGQYKRNEALWAKIAEARHLKLQPNERKYNAD